MIKGYPKGSNISLINILYHKPRKLETGKYSKDSITIIFKDNLTGRKYHETIDEPTYEYYMVKPEERVDYPQLFIEKHKVDKVIVKYTDLLKDVADKTGNLDYYYENLKTRNNMANRLLHTDPSIFMSDMHIEDYYKFKFIEYYGLPETVSITKSYIDIEADTIFMKGDFPDLGECPINAVTFINEETNEVYTLLLRNKNNPLIEQFENILKTRPEIFFNKLRETIIKTVGSKKNEIRYGLDKLKFILNYYDDELELLYDLFGIVNELEPDFVLAWNMGFDIPYIIERLKNLKVDPASVLCRKDFKTKEAYYFVDENNRNEFAERGDYARISSHSVYIDQLIHFASRRKGQSLFKSYKLDYIGEKIAKVNKLDYSHITTDIAQLPYLDYTTFVIYNIIDTLVQKCVEQKTDDINFVYNKALVNSTRYDKCHRNTLYLKNRAVTEFLEDDLIMGNNCNLNTPKVGYKGGLVTDPLLNLPNGVELNGVPTRVYRNAVDYDFKALYPSLTRQSNMGPNTQIGKLNIEEVVNHNENMFNDPDYDRGGAFAEDLISKNYFILCSRWLHLANYKDLMNDIMENIRMSYAHAPFRQIDTNGYIIPFNISESKIVKPFSFGDKTVKPFTIYKTMPNIRGIHK